MVIIINLGSKKTPQISEALSAINIPNKIVQEDTISIEEIEKSDALILSGSPVLLSEIPGGEYNQYLIRYDFIRSLKIPVLGICFGHQLIGILHGGRIGKCTPDRSWQSIKKIQSHSVFKNFNDSFQMMQDHQEQVTVPPHFIHLASSSICENEAMLHPSKKIISVQFHPEVSEENGLQFFRNFGRYAGLINNEVE